MKKVKTLLITQSIITLLLGFYLISYAFPEQKVSLTGHQISPPPTPSLPDENPITQTLNLFAIFDIMLAIGAVIELAILVFSAFR